MLAANRCESRLSPWDTKAQLLLAAAAGTMLSAKAEAATIALRIRVFMIKLHLVEVS